MKATEIVPCPHETWVWDHDGGGFDSWFECTACRKKVRCYHRFDLPELKRREAGPCAACRKPDPHRVVIEGEVRLFDPVCDCGCDYLNVDGTNIQDIDALCDAFSRFDKTKGRGFLTDEFGKWRITFEKLDD